MVSIAQSAHPRADGLRLRFQALRAPFLGASILPYVAGALLAPPPMRWGIFLLGLAAVAGTHLGANLINDYADTGSGVDTQDADRYGLFGGSKLIHTGDLPAAFFLHGAMTAFGIAALAVLALCVSTGRWDIVGFGLLILLLAWAYSCPPLKLSYRFLGEPVILLLFGPAVVMGGHSLQSGAFPAAESALLALPFGLLTTLVLFANEVPDHAQDMAGGKRTWVHGVGPGSAYRLYAAIASAALVALVCCIVAGVLSPWACVGLLSVVPIVKAARILARPPRSRPQCLQSSKLTLAVQSFVSLVIILDLVL